MTATEQERLDAITKSISDADAMLAANEEAYVKALQEKWSEFAARLEADMIRIHSSANTYADFVRFGADKQIEGAIFKELQRLGAWVDENRVDALVTQYKDAYNVTAWALDKAVPPETEITYNMPTELQMRQFVTDDWDNMFVTRNAKEYYFLAQELKIEIARSMIQGESVTELRDRIIDIIGTEDDGYRYRAERIARTELLGAANRARTHIYKNNSDVLETMVWITAAFGDGRLCDDCAERSGLTEEEVTDLADEQELPVNPPIHPNCLLPGNLVFCPDVVAATKSFYSGLVVKVTTKSGNVLTVTPNHPIATEHGWIPAEQLADGKQVLSTVHRDWMPLGFNPYNHNSPTVIENVFSSIKESALVVPVTMKVSAKDFHGDAAFFKSDIEVVGTNRLLLGNRKPNLIKKLCKFIFNGRNVVFEVLSCLGIGTPGLKAFMSSSNGVMGGFGPGQSLGSCHLCGHHKVSLGLCSSLDTSTNESGSDNGSRDSKLLGKFKLAHASKIFLDQIVNIEKYFYSGHVYDLQSGINGLYNCNGVIVHNCRCTWAPKLKSFKDILPEELSDGIEDFPDPSNLKNPIMEFNDWANDNLATADRGNL